MLDGNSNVYPYVYSNASVHRNLKYASTWKCIRPLVMGDCEESNAKFSNVNNIGRCAKIFEYSKQHEYLVQLGNVIVLTHCDSVGGCLVSMLKYIGIAVELNLGFVFEHSVNAIDSLLEPNHIDYKSHCISINPDKPGCKYNLNPTRSKKIIEFNGATSGYIAVNSQSVESNRKIQNLMKLLQANQPKSITELLKIPGLITESNDRAHSYACYFRYLFRRTHYAMHAMSKIYKTLKLDVVGRSGAGPSGTSKLSIWAIKSDEKENQNSIEVYDTLLSMNLKLNSNLKKDGIVITGGSRSGTTKQLNTVEINDFISKYAEFNIKTTADAGSSISPSESIASMYEVGGVRQVTEFLMMLDATYLVYNAPSHWTILVTHILNMQCKKTSIESSTSSEYMACSAPSNFPLLEYPQPMEPVIDYLTPNEAGFDLTGINPKQILEKVTMKTPCGEPLWCTEAEIIQKRIQEWQQKTPAQCAKSNYLIFNPVNFGIGSMLHMAASALSVAICTNRVLYLANTGIREIWKPRSKFPDCDATTSLECYFHKVTTCKLSARELGDPSKLPELTHDNWSKLANTRIVRASGSIPDGPCSFCSPTPKFPFIADLSEKDAFLGHEAPIMAQLVRYVLRPLPWFQQAIVDFIATQEKQVQYIPRPFASVHVRYGDKHKEAPRKPLRFYMEILKQHRPEIRDVFLSTETSSVIQELRKSYPDYSFYNFDYKRIESTNPNRLPVGAHEMEFIASFANLYVSINADAFVGSLTSNWCRLLHELERTRGDAGTDYFSVDTGSQFSRCYGL